MTGWLCLRRITPPGRSWWILLDLMELHVPTWDDDVRHSNSCQGSKPTCSSVASEVAIGFAIPKTKMPLQSRLPSWPLCVSSACLESELSVCFLLSGLKAWLGTSLCCRIPNLTRNLFCRTEGLRLFGGDMGVALEVPGQQVRSPCMLAGAARVCPTVVKGGCVAVWCLTLEFRNANFRFTRVL